MIEAHKHLQEIMALGISAPPSLTLGFNRALAASRSTLEMQDWSDLIISDAKHICSPCPLGFLPLGLFVCHGYFYSTAYHGYLFLAGFNVLLTTFHVNQFPETTERFLLSFRIYTEFRASLVLPFLVSFSRPSMITISLIFSGSDRYNTVAIASYVSDLEMLEVQVNYHSGI